MDQLQGMNRPQGLYIVPNIDLAKTAAKSPSGKEHIPKEERTARKVLVLAFINMEAKGSKQKNAKEVIMYDDSEKGSSVMELKKATIVEASQINVENHHHYHHQNIAKAMVRRRRKLKCNDPLDEKKNMEGND